MSEFVDEAQIHAKGGDGGAGAVSFRREAHVARGGPDGGDGGRGGDIWLEASEDQASLIAFRDHPHRRAGDGGRGGGKRRHGANGSDLVVKVPVGTVVRAKDSGVLADLSLAGDRWMAAEGGRGGRGNARFLTNRRRAPAFAEQREPGEERWLDLELKLFADVAIVGLPNAGKSTLISRVSAARPKVADYPFTTLVPHLGVVRYGRPVEETEFVVADIPGLVEGAAEGRGLGHLFLRHVERARVLLVVLDLAASDGRRPAEQERILLEELARYRPELLERPRLVIGTKADLVLGGLSNSVECDRARDEFDGRVPATCSLVVSSVTGAGIDELLGRLAGLVSDARAASTGPGRAVVIHRPVGEGIEIVRDDDGAFVVRGRAASRAVSLSDLNDDDAVSYVQDRLRRLGVERALARAGIRDGDTVRIGALEFTYEKDRHAIEVAPRVRGAKRRGRRRASG